MAATSKNLKKVPSNSMVDTVIRETLHHEVAGNVTADSSKDFIAPFPFRFTEIGQAILQAATTGADSVDDLTLELDVLINGTSIFATKPQLDKTADDGSNTLTAVSGKVVPGTLSSDADELEGVKGDIITVTIDVTRTTPDTEAADVRAAVILKEVSDYDPRLGQVRS